MSKIFTPLILVCHQGKEDQEEEKYSGLGTFRELLYNDKEILQKRVILLGEAGAGKTTFCKHLTDVWCTPSTQPQFSDDTVIKQFKFFFYVSCRFAKEEDTVLDMIKDQLFCDEKMRDVALCVLKNDSECCLIVLDGADESKGSATSETGRRGDIAGLPGMAGVDGCVILITSRPWRFHALSEKTRDTFRRLKINGIDNLEGLATRILQRLEEPDPKQLSKEFLRQMRERDMSELMKMPLLLIIALGGWVDDKSLHRSVTLNYINMIHSLVSRSKGQAGWSDPKSKLKRLIPNLDKLEVKWELQSNKLPDVFWRYESIQRFAGLFLSLGEIAFDLLLEKQEHSLVFSNQVLKKYHSVNDESVNVCLALGILSKAETTTRGLRKLESYAFCHKTFQEFFAALWLASNYEYEKSKLYKCLKSYRDLMSYEILIMFLCGFDPEAGKQFWIFVAEEVEVMVEEEILKSWDIKLERVRKMKEVTDLVCKCMKEHGFDQKDQTSDQIYFCIPHIVIDLYTSNNDILLLCHVMEEYPCNVKSLYVSWCQSELQTLCSGLQSLKLSDLPSVSEHSKSEHSQSENSHSEHNDIEHSDRERSDSEHSDSEHRHSLENLQSASEQRNSLSSLVLDLQKHDKLETLSVGYLSIEGMLLPVEGARITSLELDNVTLSHHGCKQLSESLTSSSCLEDLSLAVRCRKHSDSCCIPVLDLQKHDRLETLKLRLISIEGLLLPMEETRVRLLDLVSVTMPHYGCEQLSESLTSSSCLEKLYLMEVRCIEHSDSSCIPVLDLQKHAKLETLELRSISIEGLLLPVERVRIRLLRLDVTITHHGCEQLSAAFSSRPKLENWRPFESLIYGVFPNKVQCREHSDNSCQQFEEISTFINNHLK